MFHTHLKCFYYSGYSRGSLKYSGGRGNFKQEGKRKKRPDIYILCEVARNLVQVTAKSKKGIFHGL